MHCRITVPLLAVTLLSWSSICFAPDAAKAAPDATKAQAKPMDQTTPKNTLRLFMAAVQAGEVEKVRACLHTSTPSEEKFAGGYADVAVGVAKMKNALMEKFGEKVAQGFNFSTTIEQRKRIEEADEKISGETATIEVKGAEPLKLDLVRVNGEWKISVKKMLAGKSAKVLEVELGTMQSLSAAANEVAAETAAEKHTSIEAAMKALQEKLAKPRK